MSGDSNNGVDIVAQDTELLCENCESKIVEAMTTIEDLKSLEFKLIQIRQELRNLLAAPNCDKPFQKITQENETDVEKTGWRLRKYFAQCKYHLMIQNFMYLLKWFLISLKLVSHYFCNGSRFE